MTGGLSYKKYDWGVREKNKMYGGASAKKIKCVGGVRDFFQSAPPLRISNGIARSLPSVSLLIELIHVMNLSLSVKSFMQNCHIS